MSDYTDTDIEEFTYNLGIAIYDLNKKHNDVIWKTNLGNSMVMFFRFMKGVKKGYEEEAERNSDK